GLPKGDASIIIQLRTNHIPLNAYLFRFRKSITPLCVKCLAKRIRVKETVNHFLFICPAWNTQRRELQKEIGLGKARSLKGMLSDKDAIEALL
ncbi:hypothetical protein BDN72DRAFT_745763, partial [Pluteus cervinus]